MKESDTIMCGIIALAGKKIREISAARVDAMLDSLSHRGPDDRGLLPFLVPNPSMTSCILGQTRLSIIDLSGGHQPMADNARKIAITFNGEIYNYRQLKSELESKGHAFSTKSDTEVILKAYLEYGEACVNRLEGMFAFALWDDDRKILFGARDRFGERPLYYAKTDAGDFVFASEIKALLASGTFTPKLNREALDAYIAISYVPPHITIYENVSIVPPASVFTVRDNTISVRPYWKLAKKESPISYADAKAETARLLERSVTKMMVAADVEVGALLSGGVDSTLVTYFAQKASGHPVKTFSVGYEHYINELPFAEQASKKFGTDHYTLQATGSMVESLRAACAYLDEPNADPSNFPQYLISRLASSKVKVALTGDGADELFMGYGWYWKHLNLSWKKDFLAKVFPRPFRNFIKGIEIFSPAERQKLRTEPVRRLDFVPPEILAAPLDDVDKINLFDLSFYLPGKLLSKVDRTAMMNSLEIRCPFLDRELAEFTYNMPRDFKISRENGKLTLKDVLADVMPRDFVYRKKQGFGAPVGIWLQGAEMKELVMQTLGEKNPMYGFLKHGEVKRIADSFYSGKDPRAYYKVWSLLCLGLWFESHHV